MGSAAHGNLGPSETDPDRPERDPAPEGGAEVEAEQDYTLRYMTRFGCIGPDCEDNCCRDGWRVDVDAKSYHRLELATRGHPEERKLFKQSFRRLHEEPVESRGRRARRKKPPERYVIKMREDNSCPFLTGEGFCHLHAKFGEAILSHTCSAYPRWLVGVGERVTLTGLLSCPEVARELLLRSDAIEVEPLDLSTLPRVVRNVRYAARDVRPYYALQDEVRELVWWLLRRRSYSLEQRLFFVTYFANRTADVLDRGLAKGDVEAVRREIRLLKKPAVLRAIAHRYERVETPSALVVRVARSLVRKGVLDRERPNFRALVDRVFDSYMRLRELVAAGELEGAEVPEGVDPYREVNSREVMAEYRRRKARILRLEPERVEQYFCHFAYHYWLHRMPVDSPNVLVHLLRMLTEMAVQKFLFFSHPDLHRELDVLESNGARSEPSSSRGPLAAAEGGDPIRDVIDRYAVDVIYKVARHIEHSTLIDNLERALERIELDTAGGAMYLIRF